MVTDTHRCIGCELKEIEREAIPEEEKGVFVFLKPNPELAELLKEGGGDVW